MSEFEKQYFTKLVKINSNDKSSGTSNNFRLHFNDTQLNKVQRISVRSVRFGNYQYNINQYNSSWVLNTTLNGTRTITIPEGQYTTILLIAQIETIYNALPITGKIDLTQSSITGKLTLVMTGDTYTIGGGNINRTLGFVRPIVVASSNQTAQVIPSLHGLTSVHILSSKLAQGNLLKPAQDTESKDLLIDVPISAPFGQQNIWVEEIDSLSSIIFTHPRNLQDIDISLIDQNGNPVLLDESHEVEIFIKVYFQL